MSKNTKLAVFAILTLIVFGFAGWMLFRPKTKDNFSSQEISIKQAEIPDYTAKKYEDWAGFSFDYPGNLTVKEIELDNPDIYSSLEIYGSDAKKMTVRVSDTKIASLADWQKSFAAANAVKKIDQARLDDLDAVTLQYGAPAAMVTAALKDGVLYQIDHLADNGFWDRAHSDLVDSFKFTTSIGNKPAAAATTNEAITLVEEAVE